VEALGGKGVVFLRITGLSQDEFGLLMLGGKGRVAWMKDPDGNVLSVTDVE
jgi:hypothetical protein